LKNKVYYTSLPDNKSKIYGGAYGIHDQLLLNHRDRSIKKFTSLNSAKMSAAENIKRQFIETYPSWMFKSFDFQNHLIFKMQTFLLRLVLRKAQQKVLHSFTYDTERKDYV
jgi:hypothetical protein